MFNICGTFANKANAIYSYTEQMTIKYTSSGEDVCHNIGTYITTDVGCKFIGEVWASTS